MSDPTDPQAGEQPAEDVELGVESPSTGTAAEKIRHTLKEMSEPGEDAGALELTLGSVAMGLEGGLDEQLEQSQATGELDAFVLSLTRWIAMHRSDSAQMLLVVEVPRKELPAHTRLLLLDKAYERAGDAASPL